MNLGLSGKKVVVTGGSSGIGAAIVKTFLEEGAHVYFCGRDQIKIDTVLAELAQYSHLHAKQLDVTQEQDFKAWIDEIGQVDVFVPNVSALSSDWEQCINTDVLATVRNIDCVLPALTGDNPAVTFIGSTSASVSERGGNAYGAMKAAVTHYVQSLSKTHAGKIRFNIVAPAATLFDGGGWDKFRIAAPERFEEKVNNLPMKRLATPQEIADGVVFVSSARASYIAGEVIHIDGGEADSASF
ncbi:SDR family NAD(P)-dependent oxidoreductase [Vibrio gallicus]|uniref:SDR family NAD(P)-dependent oxidoreductase n=1 Tax=Vibrio gallicus TaxID=190897 RepID=UPI0021C2BCF4|nr:SDR family oxidoreductase [Vibrio gallicus]